MSEFSFQSMPEQEVLIDLPDTDYLKIKGVLRGSYDQPLAVLIHGRPGWGNELLQFMFARYLSKFGIASLRLSLYSPDKETRNLVDAPLEINANDIDTVVEYLRAQGVKKLFAEGHSFGGLALLKSKAKFDAVILWDPTHGLAYGIKDDDEAYAREHRQECDGLIVDTRGTGFVSTKAFENFQQTVGDTTDLARGKGYPLKVISAGKGVMTQLGGKYIEVADSPKEHAVLDARHQLDDSDDAMIELFKQSGEWFKKFL